MGNSNGKPVVFTDEGQLPHFHIFASDAIGTAPHQASSPPAHSRASTPAHLLTLLLLAVNLNHFRLLRVVGKGAFGKVRIVERKDTGLTFALKYIRKDEVVRSESVRNIIRERRMLEHLNHAFLCNLRYSFQDIEYLYLVVDLMNGGDLRFHISRKTFTEDAVRFWMAELGCALRYCHGQGIVHRDLKPDNVLLDSDGHVHLADFNVASEYKPDKVLHSKSGTLAYLAPEVYAGTGYLTEVDWWSLGVTFYECIYNKRPFSSHGHEKLEKEILKASPNYPVTQPPVSIPCMHAMQSLLEKDTRKRIGATGFDTYTDHSFFRRIDFEALEKKQIRPVFVPSSEKTNFDATYDLEELLLEEAPLEARARRQKPRVQLKDDATQKEIRTDELHRMIETLFEPFDYTTVTDYKGFVDSPSGVESSLDILENANTTASSKYSTDDPDLDRVATKSHLSGSPNGSPPMTTHGQAALSNHSEYYPATENLAGRQPPRSGGGAPRGGGLQVITNDDGTAWEGANKKETRASNGSSEVREGGRSTKGKPNGMLGFLSRKKGRERSPKPMEAGVLGKEGARVVVGGR